MSQQTVTCDKCHQGFVLTLKQKPIKGGGAEQFFRCPHCKHHYTVAFITARGVELQQAIQVATGEELTALRLAMAAEVSAP